MNGLVSLCLYVYGFSMYFVFILFFTQIFALQFVLIETHFKLLRNQFQCLAQCENNQREILATVYRNELCETELHLTHYITNSIVRDSWCLISTHSCLLMLVTRQICISQFLLIHIPLRRRFPPPFSTFRHSWMRSEA